MGSKNPVEVIAESVTRSAGDVVGTATQPVADVVLPAVEEFGDTLTAHIEANIIDPLLGERAAGVGEGIEGVAGGLSEDLLSGSTEETKQKRRLKKEAVEAAAKAKRGRKGTDEAFGFSRGRARARGSSTLLGGGGRGPSGRGVTLLGG